jgi:transposase-like protein
MYCNECVEILGLDRSKIDLYQYYSDEQSFTTEPTSIDNYPSVRTLHSINCPRCNRKNLRTRKQSLLMKIFSVKKSFTCNTCSFHFDL